jgi:hypothetical protein
MVGSGNDIDIAYGEGYPTRAASDPYVEMTNTPMPLISEGHPVLGFKAATGVEV